MARKGPGGAPRTVTPPEEEMIALGKEMIDWVSRNRPLHINQWYSVHKGILWETYKEYCRRAEFAPYNERALAIIGENYINGTVNASIAHRFMRHYFKDIKEDENELITFKAEQQGKQDRKTATETITAQTKVSLQGQSTPLING